MQKGQRGVAGISATQGVVVLLAKNVTTSRGDFAALSQSTRLGSGDLNRLQVVKSGVSFEAVRVSYVNVPCPKPSQSRFKVRANAWEGECRTTWACCLA